ncbi:hypothetical protein FXB39_09795 [Nocardioides sp. BGMRC 2183]|nr:hypothetical protein FXB39_09795 [Nocardioides sp. BGMRC 2183]
MKLGPRSTAPTLRATVRLLAILVAALSLVLTGFVAGPAVAGDDKGLGPSTSDPSGDATDYAAAAGDAWVKRMHPTANNERVDLREARIDKVWDMHKVNFTALARVVEWARSPRLGTSRHGIDRGVYKYRIYEYIWNDGELEKTGRWVVIKFFIEWGDGMADRGWLVTAYPTWTHSGKPPKDAKGKTYCPEWLASSAVMGPINHDRFV